MFSVYTVCFFGHRQIEDFQTVEQSVEKLIETLLTQHEYVEFLIGRDGEFDQIVTSSILRYRKRIDMANCSLAWVMPYLKADYTNNQENYDNYYDSVEVCEQSSQAHPKAAIQIRNQTMVDRSDLCVFYVCRNSGGAYKTFQYANRQGKLIINLALIT
ncbi:MAG: hypothetical protein ACI4W1_00010 [Ruminococcus sp.]